MDLLPYFRALWGYWWALMSCAFFTLLGAYTLLARKSNTWVLWTTFGAAVIMLFIASFLAWRGNHRALLALQERLKSPEFIWTQGSSWWGRDHRGKLAMIVLGDVSNPHGPPSSAINWIMKIEANSKTEVGEIPILPKQDITMTLEGRKETLGLQLSSWLPRQSQQPISTGGTASGWIMAVFDDI